MNKYIIKNCPCFNAGHQNLRFNGECLDLTQCEDECCANITNCTVKKIVEKCKKEVDPTQEDWTREKENLSKKILSMLEIEECE